MYRSLIWSSYLRWQSLWH